MVKEIYIAVALSSIHYLFIFVKVYEQLTLNDGKRKHKRSILIET